jgi:hypothetical protein
VENFLASRVTLGFSRKASWSGVCILPHKNTEYAETNISTTFALIREWQEKIYKRTPKE